MRKPTPNRILSYALVYALSLVAGLLFSGRAMPVFAALDADSKVDANQEVLKINEECNAAELRADIAAMDACETDDFTHTHANGMVEHKAEFLKGVGSGEHHFLALDLPMFTSASMAPPPSSRSTCTFAPITAAESPMSIIWS